HQHVERVAVVGQGVRNEAVVGRVEHGGGHEAVNEQAIGVVIDLVLDRRVVGRNLDGDVDVVRQVFAGGQVAVAHWMNGSVIGRLAGGGKKVGAIIGAITVARHREWGPDRPDGALAGGAVGRADPVGRTAPVAGRPRGRLHAAGPAR